MKLDFMGVDSWDRPVYVDGSGRYWKDVDPRATVEPVLCSAVNNEFDGEPDCPFHGDYEFSPGRVVWVTKRGAERFAIV